MAEKESLFRKAFSPGEEFSKDDIFDILFYAKEVFGFLIGVIIALVGVMGLTAIVVFVLAISLLNYLYVFKFLGVDEEVVETKDVLKEHFMNGFFPFLLSWIVVYNLINFSWSFVIRFNAILLYHYALMHFLLDHLSI